MLFDFKQELFEHRELKKLIPSGIRNSMGREPVGEPVAEGGAARAAAATDGGGALVRAGRA